MTSARSTLSGLAFAALVFTSPADLSAQCCKDKAPTTTVASKSGAATKKLKVKGKMLFNDVCPLTGNVTSVNTPVVAHKDFLVSLCCAGCIGSFAKLQIKTKDTFVARYTGKNRRTAFLSKRPAKGAAKAATAEPCADCDAKDPTAKTDCCKDAKPAAKVVAKADCCKEGKPAAKADCCKEGKPAAKADCCKEGKPAAKADCCKEGKPAAKADCCKEGKPAAKADCCKEGKPAAKADCCKEGKPAAKADCCKEGKPAAKADCCKEGKPAAKADCCKEGKPAAKADCCKEGKPAAKADCCKEGKVTTKK